MAASQRDRARGDDDDLPAAGAERGDVVGKTCEPGRPDAARVLDQQRRADLDHQAPGAGEQRRGAHRVSIRIRVVAPPGATRQTSPKSSWPSGAGRSPPSAAMISGTVLLWLTIS